MKPKEELVQILKDNFTNEYGQIELNGLDLGIDLVIRECKIKNYESDYNEVEGDYDSYSNEVEGNYDSYSNEVEGDYYSYSNEVEGDYYNTHNKIEGYQYYPKYAIIKGKKYDVDFTDNYYLVIEKSTTKNGLTIIKGFNRDNNRIWLYKNNFVAYHDSTKEKAKEGFKRKLKGFEKNIELLELIKEQGYITRENYHTLTGACEVGIQDFANRIGKKDSDKLTLEELQDLLKPNEYGYNLIKKWGLVK